MHTIKGAHKVLGMHAGISSSTVFNSLPLYYYITTTILITEVPAYDTIIFYIYIYVCVFNFQSNK